MSIKRGAFIVLEGCDRSGKTTQCKKLGKHQLLESCYGLTTIFFSVELLNNSGRIASYMNFPDRTTPVGLLIDNYLRNKQNFTDEGIHLLFSLNRWESKDKIMKLLNAGTTLIVDRYSYSGVAFSAAKGLNFDWCKSPETGLPKPDMVIYLTLSSEAMMRRSGFGTERYEIPEFQLNVRKMYEKMIENPLWKVIDADKTLDELSEELKKLIENSVDGIGENDILGSMW